MNILSLDIWNSLPRACFAFVLLGLASHQVGEWVVSRTRAHSLRLIVGFNCLGLIGLGTGWLTTPTVSTLVFSALAGWWIVRHTPKVIAAAHRRTLALPPGLRSAHNLAAAVAVLITLGPALTYPSSWDELTYHTTLPMRWLEARQFTIQADLPYSALPSLNEIVFTCLGPIEYAITPRLISWSLWLLGTLQLRATLGHFVSNPQATILAGAVAFSPIALMISANCYVESLIWANCIALCAIVASDFTSGRESQTANRDLSEVALIGGAVATKITAVGLGLLPILAFLFVRARPRRIHGTLLCLGFSAIFALPFYLRTWIGCGNPLAPYFADWFTVDQVAIQTSEYHTELAVDNFGIPGIAGQVASPVVVAFANDLFDGCFGWQWLAIIGLAIYGLSRSIRADDSQYRPFVQMFVALSILLAIIWSLSAQQARFGLPFYVTATIAAAIGIKSLPKRSSRAASVALLSMGVISLPWNNAGYYVDSWFSVAKLLPTTDYLRDGVGDSYAELTAFMWDQAGPAEKVLTLFEHRLAYLPQQVEIATPYFQPKYFQNPQAQTARDIAAELRAQDIRFVIFTEKLVGPDVSQRHVSLQQAWFHGFDQCLADGSLKIVWKGQEHAVAEVVPQNDQSR